MIPYAQASSHFLDLETGKNNNIAAQPKKILAIPINRVKAANPASTAEQTSHPTEDLG